MTDRDLHYLNNELEWALELRRRFLEHVQSLIDAISEIYVVERECEKWDLLDSAVGNFWDLVEHKLQRVCSELADAKSSLCENCATTKEEEYASIKQTVDIWLRKCQMIRHEECEEEEYEDEDEE
jgi:hypothetical protein